MRAMNALCYVLKNFPFNTVIYIREDVTEWSYACVTQLKREKLYTFITRALYPTSGCVKVVLPETRIHAGYQFV